MKHKQVCSKSIKYMKLISNFTWQEAKIFYVSFCLKILNTHKLTKK